MVKIRVSVSVNGSSFRNQIHIHQTLFVSCKTMHDMHLDPSYLDVSAERAFSKNIAAKFTSKLCDKAADDNVKLC